MPTVPVEQNRVGIADASAARLRAPDQSGTGLEALGRGVQMLGQGAGQYAEEQAKIQLHADKIGGRNLALEYQASRNKLIGEYTTLQGQSATDQGAAYQQKLIDLRKEFVQRAGNPRMRTYFDELSKPLEMEGAGTIADHSSKELFQFSKTTYQSGADLAAQQAAQFASDPAKFAASMAQGHDYLDKLGHLQGWDANTAAAERLKFSSGVHSSVIDGMLALPNADPTAVQAYVEAHKGEMTVGAQNSAIMKLRDPLEKRDAAAGYLEVMSAGSAKPEAASAEAGKYALPIAGRVSNTYDQHVARGSHGMDIAAAQGSAIHPMADGIVTEVGEDDRSGRFVIVKHPDGHTSSYSHLGGQSVKAGEQVTAETVLGTVGMTGHTTGPHLHLRVKDADGADVDPAKLLGSAAAGGQVIGSPSAARNHDIAGELARIEARTDWTFEKREAVKAYARQHAAQDEAALADRYRDSADKVTEWIGNYSANNGGKYPPPEALPAFASGMKPADLAELRGTLARAKKAEYDKAEQKAQDSVALGATLRMYNDPDGFLKADVSKEYLGKVSPGDYAQIATAQARMRQSASQPKPWDPYADSHSALTTYLRMNPPPGGKLDDQSTAAALKTIKDLGSDLAAKKGAPPTTSEMYDIASRVVGRKAQVPGVLWGTREVPVYGVSSVPQADRAKIVAAYRKVYGGKDPSDADVVQWYRRQLAESPQ